MNYGFVLSNAPIEAQQTAHLHVSARFYFDFIPIVEVIPAKIEVHTLARKSEITSNKIYRILSVWPVMRQSSGTRKTSWLSTWQSSGIDKLSSSGSSNTQVIRGGSLNVFKFTWKADKQVHLHETEIAGTLAHTYRHRPVPRVSLCFISLPPLSGLDRLTQFILLSCLSIRPWRWNFFGQVNAINSVVAFQVYMIVTATVFCVRRDARSDCF